MSTQMMSTAAPRVGVLKGEILKHVIPVEVLGKFSVRKPHPKNSSETVKFRRWLPKGATTSSPNTWNVDPAAHQLSEGETPNGETLTPQDITATLVEYGFIYRWSNRVEDLYEDMIPPEAKKLTGERMSLLLEMIRWGQLRAGTNVFRAGAVASRSLITGVLTAGVLRNVARSMSRNIAMMMTGILSASPKIGTQPIEAAYIAVGHTDLEYDIRQLSGFVHKSEYGTMQTCCPQELGSWETYRFVLSPHLAPYLNAGTTTTANTRLAGGVANSAGSEAIDVYPLIVLAEEAFGDVPLRGKEGLNVAAFPANTRTKDDPLGQRGSISAQTYFTCVRLNEGHMAVVEVGCTHITS